MTDYAVTNPATGEQVKTFPTITDEELAAAIKLAHETHQRWSRTTSVEERAALVRRVGELHTERREELAAITVREMGKPTEQALGEIDFCADIYGYYADNGPDLMKDEPIKLLAQHDHRQHGAPQARAAVPRDGGCPAGDLPRRRLP